MFYVLKFILDDRSIIRIVCMKNSALLTFIV